MKALIKIGGAVLMMAGGLLLHMALLAKRKNVIRHEIRLAEKNPEGRLLTVFFISDIHRRNISEKLLAKVRQDSGIDIVIIGGDLAEKGVPEKRVRRNVGRLSSLGELFYIWGNNDREIGEAEIRRIITDHGGFILDNCSTGVPGHPSWCIAGTDDPSSNNVDVKAALSEVGDYQYLFAAVHTPSLFRKVDEIREPDISVAGHTHGGQIRFGPFGLHDLGSFIFDGKRARLISNGYGTSLLPLRLGAAPESHIIRIYY